MLLLPKIVEDLESKTEYRIPTSKTYQIDFKNGTILGMIDGVESLKQAIFLMLSTKRFEYIIYSWNYGVEIINTKIDNLPLLKSEIKRFVTEALSCDERIVKVAGFEITQTQVDSISVSFEVVSVFGNFTYEMEV